METSGEHLGAVSTACDSWAARTCTGPGLHCRGAPARTGLASSDAAAEWVLWQPEKRPSIDAARLKTCSKSVVSWTPAVVTCACMSVHHACAAGLLRTLSVSFHDCKVSERCLPSSVRICCVWGQRRRTRLACLVIDDWVWQHTRGEPDDPGISCACSSASACTMYSYGVMSLHRQLMHVLPPAGV